jgi:hypothetical protein
MDTANDSNKESIEKRLNVLRTVLGKRREMDKEFVMNFLSEQEKALYVVAREYYALGSGGGYYHDQRHIDFSTGIAVGFSDTKRLRNILVPCIIFHDSGRYKMPVGVTKIKHDTFTSRMLHMHEGMRLAKKHMTEQGYNAEETDLASRLVGVHDWTYARKFDPEKELKEYNPKVDTEQGTVRLSEIFGTLLKISETGILDTIEFELLSDSDRVNVPAVSSFHHDYLGRNTMYAPLEFCLMRSARYDLLDSHIAEFDGHPQVHLDTSPEAIKRVKKNAKSDPIYTERGLRIMREVISRRILDAQDSPILNIGAEVAEEDMARHFDESLDKENEYVIGTINKEVK